MEGDQSNDHRASRLFYVYPLRDTFIPTFTPWEASISLETLAKSFLNPHNMHCRVLGVRSEQITGSPVSRKGWRRMRGQLFICEQLKEIQRFLARCSQIHYKRLHTVVVVSIDVALITLVSKRQPFLSDHRAQVAGQTRLAIEREAQQYLDVALIFCQMGKVIFSSPSCFAGNCARRAWTLKFFRAQPLKIRSDFLLRCSKSVQDL